MKEPYKRTSVRLPYTTSVRLKMNGYEWGGWIENFSTKGVLLRLDVTHGRPLPPLHSQGVLHFQVDGVEMETHVSVVRSSDDKLGLSFVNPP